MKHSQVQSGARWDGETEPTGPEDLLSPPAEPGWCLTQNLHIRSDRHVRGGFRATSRTGANTELDLQWKIRLRLQQTSFRVEFLR